MGVILEDMTREDRWVACNWWNWRPTLELLRLSKLFDDVRLEMDTHYFGTLSVVRAFAPRMAEKKMSHTGSSFKQLQEEISIAIRF